MAEENTQPIIVKKIKKGGHGHHGGAWKIAYADFVTAMMAFFLLLWLLGGTTKEEKTAISDYFENPSAIAGPGGASTSMIKIGGGKDVTYSDGDTKRGSNEKDIRDATKEKMHEDASKDGVHEGSAKDMGADEATKQAKDALAAQDKQKLTALKNQLEEMIEASVVLKPFKDQLLLDITTEGLRVQIVDKENRPMFSSGSANLQPYTSQILKEIGRVINRVPNRISLSGHTDAIPYSANFGAKYSNWELSADRANASRRALQDGGMDEAKMARVVGLSSAVPFDSQNPNNPINRRISIIVLNHDTEDAILHDEGNAQATAMAAGTVMGASGDPTATPPVNPPPITMSKPNLGNPSDTPTSLSTPKEQPPISPKTQPALKTEISNPTTSTPLATEKTTPESTKVGTVLVDIRPVIEMPKAPTASKPPAATTSSTAQKPSVNDQEKLSTKVNIAPNAKSMIDLPQPSNEASAAAKSASEAAARAASKNK